MNLIKKESTVPEEHMEKKMVDDLDDLIDDDFLQSTPSNQKKNVEDKQAVETLQDELNELYENYGDEIFDNEVSETCTPRGFSNLKSVTTKNGSSKKVDKDSFGIYVEDEIEDEIKDEIKDEESKDQELPFSMADDPTTPKNPSSKKVEDYVIKDSLPNSEVGSEIKDAKLEDMHNITPLNIEKSKEKRPSSLDHTPPPSSKKKKRIPENLKKKLMSLTREGSVIRNYSAERFRESPSDKG